MSYPLGQISAAPPCPAAILIGLPVALILMAVLVPWVLHGTFPPGLAGLGIAVLLIDLSTTGGIGIPGVSQSLWLLLALGLGGAWPRNVHRAAGITLLAIGLGLAVACHQTSFSRVLPCQSSLWLAQRESLDGRWQSALAAAERAVAADPRSSDAHAFLAQFHLDSWLAHLDPADYDAFETHDALARRMPPVGARVAGIRRPLPPGLYENRSPGAARAAAGDRPGLAIARRTIELYPGSGLDCAALAMLYELSGDQASYRSETRAALELDRHTPHEDKKLPESVRRKLEAAER